MIYDIWTTKEELMRWWEDNDDDGSEDESVDKQPMGSIKNDAKELPIYCYYNTCGRLVTVYEYSYKKLNKLRIR